MAHATFFDLPLHARNPRAANRLPSWTPVPERSLPHLGTLHGPALARQRSCIEQLPRASQACETPFPKLQSVSDGSDGACWTTAHLPVGCLSLSELLMPIFPLRWKACRYWARRLCTACRCCLHSEGEPQVSIQLEQLWRAPDVQYHGVLCFL